MDAHLIPFRKQPPEHTEVLYYVGYSKYTWVPDKRFRKSALTKAFRDACEEWGNQCYYRPPRGKKADPVRLWGGRRWTWYWLYKNP